MVQAGARGATAEEIARALGGDSAGASPLPKIVQSANAVWIAKGRPTESGDRSWWFQFQPWRSIEQMGSGGSVFFVPESAFTTARPVSPNVYAAAIIGGLLRGKRSVTPDQAVFFTNFYMTVAVSRLGMRKSSAVEPSVGVPDTAPLVAAGSYSWRQDRMTRVLAALEYRAGADNFRAGIDDFVRATGAPGTAKELVEAIGRRAGVDLSHTYDDYFAGSALPELTLADVVFKREGGRWQVTGAVKNIATGEAFVPLALRTSQESLWQTVRVDGGGTARFAFSAPGEPRSLQLDPDGVCYRRAVVGLVDNVEIGAPASAPAGPQASAPARRRDAARPAAETAAFLGGGGGAGG